MQLPVDFVRDIENYRTRSGTVKINLALSHQPGFRDDPEATDPDLAGASMMIAPTMRYIEKAFEDARGGRASRAPFSETCIPSYYDHTLAPEGMQVVSMFTQWVPHEWAQERNQDGLEAYADRMVEIHDDFMPGLKDAVVARQVIGPWEMENEWGLVGGNIFHGELSPSQLFHMRPAPGLRRLPYTYPRPLPGVLGYPLGWWRNRTAWSSRSTRDPQGSQARPVPSTRPGPMNGDGQRIGRLDSVTIDCHYPERMASFWSSVFGTTEEWRGGDPVQYIDLAATDDSPVLRFQRVPEPKTVKDRIHLDLRVDDIDEGKQVGHRAGRRQGGAERRPRVRGRVQGDARPRGQRVLRGVRGVGMGYFPMPGPVDGGERRRSDRTGTPSRGRSCRDHRSLGDRDETRVDSLVDACQAHLPMPR